MNIHLRTKHAIAFAFGVSVALAGPLAAPAGAQLMPCPITVSPSGPACKTFDVTSYAQSVETQKNTLLTQINTAQQLKTQLQQLASLTTFTKGQWSDARANLQALATLVQQNKNLSYNDENLAAAFSQANPDFSAPVNFAKLTQTWYDNTKGAILNALQVAGLSTRQFAKDDLILNQAMLDTDGAKSQSQLAQTGNRIAAMTVEQLQKMQQMEAARQNYETAFYTQQQGSARVNSAALATWLGGSAAPGH